MVDHRVPPLVVSYIRNFLAKGFFQVRSTDVVSEKVVIFGAVPP